MRKILIYSLCLLFVYSCNNEKKQATLAKQQAYEDSIQEVRRLAEQKRADSISSYAFGDIKFGMTWEEIKNTKLYASRDIKESDIDSYSCYIKDLGKAEFHFDKDDKLNVVSFQSSYHYGNNKLQAALDEVEKFKNYISKKYGAPERIDEIPKTANFRPFQRILYAWFIYDKHILISINNDRSGSEFSNVWMECEIKRKTTYNPTMEDSEFIKQLEIEKIEKKKRDSIITDMF
jgi:hypothetical protein